MMVGRMILRIGRGYGFTLVEILVVLAIVSLLLGIGVPFFRGSSQRAKFKAAVRGVMSICNYAHYFSLSHRKECSVVLNSNNCIEVIGAEEERQFCPPTGISISLKQPIIFLSSGEAKEKVCINIKSQLGYTRDVCVSALSGKVSRH